MDNKIIRIWSFAFPIIHVGHITLPQDLIWWYIIWNVSNEPHENKIRKGKGSNTNNFIIHLFIPETIVNITSCIKKYWKVEDSLALIMRWNTCSCLILCDWGRIISSKQHNGKYITTFFKEKGKVVVRSYYVRVIFTVK